MNIVKISSIIILIFCFLYPAQASEKINCRKFAGSYGDYLITVTFSKIGKMLISVEEKDSGGYFSTPGSYSVKDSQIDFFYRGLNRTMYIENGKIKGTPYTFSISDEYKVEITLKEDKSFPSNCR